MKRLLPILIFVAALFNIEAAQLSTPGGTGVNMILQNPTSSGGNIFTTGGVWVVTISANGIANGKSSLTNNGAAFGIDTPGTRTCGIQEAYNSIPKATNCNAFAAGAVLQFQPGYFFYTNILHLTNTFPFGLQIVGSDIIGTAIVFAGTNRNVNEFSFTLGTNNPNGGLQIPNHLTVRNLRFASIIDTTNIIFCCSNLSYVDIEHCVFSSWQVLTNPTSGAGLSADGASIGGVLNTPGLVGLKIDGTAAETVVLNDLTFQGLADGAYIYSDHAYGTWIKSQFVGGSGSPGRITQWPTNSPYSIGAVVLCQTANDSIWVNMDAYTAIAGFVKLVRNGLEYESPLLINFTSLECDHPVVADDLDAPRIAFQSYGGAQYQQVVVEQLSSPLSTLNPGTGYQILAKNNPYGVNLWMSPFREFNVFTGYMGFDLGGTNIFYVGYDRQLHGNGLGLSVSATNIAAISTNTLVVSTFTPVTGSVYTNNLPVPILITGLRTKIHIATIIASTSGMAFKNGLQTNIVDSIVLGTGVLTGDDTNALPSEVVAPGAAWGYIDLSTGAGNTQTVLDATNDISYVAQLVTLGNAAIQSVSYPLTEGVLLDKTNATGFGALPSYTRLVIVCTSTDTTSGGPGGIIIPAGTELDANGVWNDTYYAPDFGSSADSTNVYVNYSGSTHDLGTILYKGATVKPSTWSHFSLKLYYQR